MELVLALVVFVVVCVLAAAYGTDSRFDRPGRQL
jgi:hypothetical protein